MRLIIKSVKIIWEGSEFHNQVLDIAIQDGIIEQLAAEIDSQDGEIWQESGSCISPGWFDLDTNFGEPGFENRDDLKSGSKAALRGGFTGLALMPNTHPPLHSRTEVEYIIQKSKGLPVDLYPLGCISKNQDGKEMAELFDMFQTGAVAFCDGNKPLQNSGLLLRALQYTQAFGARIFSYPEEPSLAYGANVHEGLQSLRLGMKGIPSLSEELMIQRDLMIAEYSGAPIHFAVISAMESVNLIRNARIRGQKVTCAVPAYHLILRDDSLVGFDTNYKVRPPLRGKQDIEALLEGITDGTISAVSSRHTPQEIEFKSVEFEMAENGMVSLEVTFSLALMALESRIPLSKIIYVLTSGPRSILGVPEPQLKVGEMANFCWFHPEKEWTFERKHLGGKSYNTPFLGSNLKGKVLGVLHKNQSTQF